MEHPTVIERTAYRQDILRKLKASPIVSLLGPRQAGKTTLARQISRSVASRGAQVQTDASLKELYRSMEL